MVLLSHSLLLYFHNLFNSFPPDNQSPLNYVPLRWAVTNWKWGRWNKGTLAAQTHSTQLPRQWGRGGWGGKPNPGKPICLDTRKKYSLGQPRDLGIPLSPSSPHKPLSQLHLFYVTQLPLLSRGLPLLFPMLFSGKWTHGLMRLPSVCYF